MDALEEWLEPTIRCELSDGLKWLESSSVDSASNTSHFEDDGSTLRVKVSKSGTVQMIKLVTFEGPIEVWVSDSIICLRGVFTTSAVDQYFHETRKRLTQDSQGGLIQIKDFEILATHSGPRPSRLTILIKDFESVGSAGSGGFGAPRNLVNLPEVDKLLDRLQKLRLRGCCKDRQTLITEECAENRDLPLGIQNEIKCSTSGYRSRSASQETFASQVSISRPVEPASLHVRNSNSASDHGKSNDLSTRPARSRSSKPIMKKLPNSHSDLLAMVQKGQVVKSNKRSKIDAPPAEPGDNNGGSVSQMVCPESNGQGEKAEITPARNAIMSERVPSLRSITGVTSCIVEYDGKEEVLDLAKPILQVEPVSLPGSLRIRCREVKISKDQQALLNCPDSWIPAEPGQRQPVGNIPLNILQSIIDQAEGYSRYSPVQDQSVTQPSRKAESTTSTSGSTSENEACQDSEPEKEISLSQWPPSSPREHIREQLPPDSSVESSLQANRAEEEVGEGYSVQKRRKLSNSPASFVSAITDSENLTSTSGRLGKIVRSSPALPATPSRQDFRTSRSSEAEGQMITGERRSLVKYDHDKVDKHSATSSNHTPTSIASEEFVPASQTCVGSHVQVFSPGILSRHQKICLNEPREIDLDSSNSSQKPETLLALSCETAHGSPEARRNHSTPTTTPGRTKFKDHGSREKLMNKSLKQRGVSPNTTLPIDTNVVMDSPEDIRDPHSPKTDIANLKLSNNPKSNADRNDFLQQAYRSTATGYDEPVLQVKATPYVNSHLLKSASIDRSHRSSPSRKKGNLVSDRARFPEPSAMPLSPNVIETSSAQISSSKPTEGTLYEFNGGEIPRKNPASADSGPGDLRVQEVATDQISGIACSSLNDTTHIEDTFISATAPQGVSSGDYVAENPPITAEDETHKTKRKFLELQPPSLETAKRHKQVDSSTFTFSEDLQTIVDPSVLGNKYRQDFYNSRKRFIDPYTKEALNSPTVVPESLTPDSNAKSISNECLPGQKVQTDAPPQFTPPKNTPVLDPKNDHTGDAIPGSEDEEKLEEAMFEERHLAAKTGWSSNATLKVDEQVTDHMQVQDTDHNLLTAREDSSIKLKVFEQFKATYRDYAATSRQFVAICRKIERLVKDGRMEHQYLWDDFIIRHKTEYPTYLSSCAEKAEDPLPYEQYYHRNIVKPLFTNGVVRPENIHQVFLSSQQVVNTDNRRHEQQRENLLGVKNVVRSKVLKNSTGSPKASDGAHKPTPTEVTVDIMIDLTSDEEVCRSAQRQSLTDFSRRKSPRSLPWMTNRPHVGNTPTKKGISRTSSSSHISQSPHRAAPLSNLKPPKGSYRLSSSPKKVEFGNDKETDLYSRAGTTLYKPVTGEAFHANQSPSKEGLNLTNFTEAQKPDAASYNNTRSDQDFRLRSSLAPEKWKDNRANHPVTPQDDQVSPKPCPTPNESGRGNATSGSQQEGQGRNEITSFTSFAKAYAAIRSGNGNSYARDKEIVKNGNGTVPRNAEKGPELKQIDVLSWRL